MRTAAFLARTGLYAGPLSLLLACAPLAVLLVQSLFAIDPAYLTGILVWAPVSIAIGVAYAIAFAVPVTLLAGLALVWLCWLNRVDPLASRAHAIRFGLIGGGIVALAEIIIIVIQLRSNISIPTGMSMWGLAYGAPGNVPTLNTWLKLSADLIFTIAIGAVSAGLAWRAPRAAQPAAVIEE